MRSLQSDASEIAAIIIGFLASDYLNLKHLWGYRALENGSVGQKRRSRQLSIVAPTYLVISHTDPAAKEAAGYGETAEDVKSSLHEKGSAYS